MPDQYATRRQFIEENNITSHGSYYSCALCYTGTPTGYWTDQYGTRCAICDTCKDSKGRGCDMCHEAGITSTMHGHNVAVAVRNPVRLPNVPKWDQIPISSRMFCLTCYEKVNGYDLQPKETKCKDCQEVYLWQNLFPIDWDHDKRCFMDSLCPVCWVKRNELYPREDPHFKTFRCGTCSKFAPYNGQSYCFHCQDTELEICNGCQSVVSVNLLDNHYRYVHEKQKLWRQLPGQQFPEGVRQPIGGNWVTVCHPCIAKADGEIDSVEIPCGRCEDLTMVGDLDTHQTYNRPICPDCYLFQEEAMWTCDDCGDTFDRQREEPYGTDDDDNCLCRHCYNEQRDMVPRSATTRCYFSWALDLPTERHFQGAKFGVEIETGWSEHNRPEHGEYHGRSRAPRPFLDNWKAESDSSLDDVWGVEIISPILQGVEGVAEVIAQMGIIKECGGFVHPVTGQHIHVNDEGKTSYNTLIYLTSVMEEFLLASTGGYSRWKNQYYSQRVKAAMVDPRRTFERRSQVQNTMPGHSVCDWDGETFEFRYPPGTLMPEQFVINHGLTQLMVWAARTISEDKLCNLALNSFDLWENSQEVVRLHRQVLIGAGIMHEFGWHKGGSWIGLPYDPTISFTVGVQDGRGASRQVSLPSEDRLLSRLDRQVQRFYLRAEHGVRHRFNQQDYHTENERTRGVLAKGSAEGMTQEVLEVLANGLPSDHVLSGFSEWFTSPVQALVA